LESPPTNLKGGRRNPKNPIWVFLDLLTSRNPHGKRSPPDQKQRKSRDSDWGGRDKIERGTVLIADSENLPPLRGLEKRPSADGEFLQCRRRVHFSRNLEISLKKKHEENITRKVGPALGQNGNILGGGDRDSKTPTSSLNGDGENQNLNCEKKKSFSRKTAIRLELVHLLPWEKKGKNNEEKSKKENSRNVGEMISKENSYFKNIGSPKRRREIFLSKRE